MCVSPLPGFHPGGRESSEQCTPGVNCHDACFGFRNVAGLLSVYYERIGVETKPTKVPCGIPRILHRPYGPSGEFQAVLSSLRQDLMPSTPTL